MHVSEQYIMFDTPLPHRIALRPAMLSRNKPNDKWGSLDVEENNLLNEFLDL